MLQSYKQNWKIKTISPKKRRENRTYIKVFHFGNFSRTVNRTILNKGLTAEKFRLIFENVKKENKFALIIKL